MESELQKQQEPISSLPKEEKEEHPSPSNKGVIIQRIGMNMVMIGVVGLLVFLVWQRVFSKQDENGASLPSQAVQEEIMVESSETIGQSSVEVSLLPISAPINSPFQGILRKPEFETKIPSRPRSDVITYTVASGDTLFSIAHNFNLKPETLLWGNFDVLQDNPHILSPNQVLNILPVDGIYYQWNEGDNLDAIAAQFKTDSQLIIDYPGNHIDLVALESNESVVETGKWLIVPGGKREIKDWGPPAITRQNPASARFYGGGHCGDVYEGAFGTGTFVWPTTERGVSGYNYSGVHPAIDITGHEGNSVFASDSGVVVYAGWSDYGYGYLIVIDHGNGWQTAYAHLSAVGVSCGQSVYQGGHIGALGNTGNSSGAHLHFELIYGGVKVNPLDYLQ